MEKVMAQIAEAEDRQTISKSAIKSEIKSMKWMTYEDAVKMITYDNTRELFKKILKEENL